MSYEDYVGLQLNKHRVRRQRAAGVLAALAANSDQDLDPGWGDALADDPLEAEEITAAANAARARSRARRRGSGGGLPW